MAKPQSPERREWLVLNNGRYWWKSNRAGYSVDILDAGLYTAVEAREIEGLRRWPQEDKAIHIGERAHELRSIRERLTQKLAALGELEAVGKP